MASADTTRRSDSTAAAAAAAASSTLHGQAGGMGHGHTSDLSPASTSTAALPAAAMQTYVDQGDRVEHSSGGRRPATTLRDRIQGGAHQFASMRREATVTRALAPASNVKQLSPVQATADIEKLGQRTAIAEAALERFNFGVTDKPGSAASSAVAHAPSAADWRGKADEVVNDVVLHEFLKHHRSVRKQLERDLGQPLHTSWKTAHELKDWLVGAFKYGTVVLARRERTRGHAEASAPAPVKYSGVTYAQVAAALVKLNITGIRTKRVEGGALSTANYDALVKLREWSHVLDTNALGANELLKYLETPDWASKLRKVGRKIVELPLAAATLVTTFGTVLTGVVGAAGAAVGVFGAAAGTSPFWGPTYLYDLFIVRPREKKQRELIAGLQQQLLDERGGISRHTEADEPNDADLEQEFEGLGDGSDRQGFRGESFGMHFLARPAQQQQSASTAGRLEMRQPPSSFDFDSSMAADSALLTAPPPSSTAAQRQHVAGNGGDDDEVV